MFDEHDLRLPAPPHALALMTRVLLILATGLILMITASIIAQVIARNVWNIGLPWAEEMARFAGVFAVYFTAPVLALRGQHVAVDVFTGLLPRVPRAACAILAELATLAFAVLTMWGGWLYLQRAWKFTTPALGVQNIWVFGPVLICLLLLVAISVWRVIAIMRRST